MRRTTARQVRTSLRRVFGDDLPDAAAELARRPAAGLRTIAAELRQAHERLIVPHWSRIRAVLDADIAYRARQLATGGAQSLFADLHPGLLGRPRAALLEALRSPATTTDLARALDVTPSAVSQHLRVLRESGLVTSERIGRTRLYATTERGLGLLGPDSATQAGESSY